MLEGYQAITTSNVSEGVRLHVAVAEDLLVERGMTVELPPRHVDADNPDRLAKG
jgi:hypothetical protein